MLDISVIVPARNAEAILEGCLQSIAAAQVREIIVIDGCSTDRTVEIAQRYATRVESDEGRGLPAARLLGARLASSETVALVDADVVLPEGSLQRLIDEFRNDGYDALQAGLRSISAGDYWGEALATHHRWGRSKNWFGLVATVFDRSTLLEHGFDSRFVSGEDIEMRWRLRDAGLKIGVSERTTVIHRFEGGWRFARGQWNADGKGLARMVRKHGLRAVPLLALPVGGAVRGVALSLWRGKPKWIPYYLSYMLFNETAMFAELAGGRAGAPTLDP